MEAQEPHQQPPLVQLAGMEEIQLSKAQLKATVLEVGAEWEEPYQTLLTLGAMRNMAAVEGLVGDTVL